MPALVSCNVHGIRVEEKALGYQLRCSLCKMKYGKGGTHVGAKDPERGTLGSCFATTNAKFWNRWEHWEIPRGIPYFLYHSALTRELYDFIVELRPSTTSGKLADNIKQLHLLEYKQRHLDYLQSFKGRVRGLDTSLLQSFTTPADPEGYNDKSITDDLITDMFHEFSDRTRVKECGKFLRTLTAICMNLDNTYKAARKATVVDDSRVHTQFMKGGILSILNEANLIISWRFCQSGSATEIMELLEGLKARLDHLGADDPEMVTVDNCCAIRKKILEVFPQLKILLDVYHFLMSASMSLRLESLRDELAELRIPIAHQRHPLEELERRRAVVEAKLDLYVYPVLTLPPEITSEIFVHSLPSHRLVSPLPSTPPLIFLKICSAWRLLALSTPALWTNLHLDVDTDHGALTAPGKLETFVETWFHRACTLPRSFSFFGDMDDSQDHSLDTILDKHAPYLRKICLCITSDSFPNLGNGTPFPVLHHLELDDANISSGGTPCDVFRLAPRLQSLRLAYVPPSALILPWEQLTTFSAEILSVEQCLSVVCKAPSLRELTYRNLYGTETTPGPSVSYPGLVSLKLTGWRSRDIIPFLALPNLQRLELSALSALPDDAVPLPLISSSSLHTLVLGRDTHMVTLPWLRVMEHLTSLELGTPLWAYKEDFFRALDRAHEPRFLPKLENFTLSNCETLEVSQHLMEALISRWPVLAAADFSGNYNYLTDMCVHGLAALGRKKTPSMKAKAIQDDKKKTTKKGKKKQAADSSEDIGA
ncbi:hypothetical protein C8J57DRAFT_1713702 [Mycena rebaudengoi]|nr:hypothetical protein C8J57DRAFT_1713702 [Mycena rebaudengoi]